MLYFLFYLATNISRGLSYTPSGEEAVLHTISNHFIFHIFICSFLNTNTTILTFQKSTSKFKTLALKSPFGGFRGLFYLPHFHLFFLQQ